MTLLRTFALMLLISLLTSCADKNDDESHYTDPKWKELDKLDPSKFYDLTVDDDSGFDGAVYHDGAYIAYKTDEENEVYVYYVSKRDITNPRDGVFVVLNYDGTLQAFGQTERMMYACEDAGGVVSLVGCDDNRGINLITPGDDSGRSMSAAAVDARGENHGYDCKSWINFGLSNVKGLGDVLTIYDLGDAWARHDSFKFTTSTFTAGVSYVGGLVVGLAVGAAVNEWEQECNELLFRLYGDAEPEIENIIPLGNDEFEVVVHILHAHSLAEPYSVNVEDNFGCRSLSTPRQIYLGVTGSNVQNADIALAYSMSDEVLIENDEGEDDIRMSAKIHIPKGKRLYLRPYLISYIKLLSENTVFINSVKLFKRQYRYGQDYIYVNPGIDFHWRQVSAIGERSSYNKPNRSIDFQIEVIAKQFEMKPDEYGQAGIVDWGYAIIDNDGSIYDRFSFREHNSTGDVNATEVSETINYTFNEDELDIDDIGFSAGIAGWHICPYISTNVNPGTLEVREIFGEPQPFDLLYSEEPDITFTGCDYYTSFMRDIGGAWGPILINDEENIYANAQSEFSVTARTKGAFFIKQATYKESGTNKYCSLFNNQTIEDFEDGEWPSDIIFMWNTSHFDKMKPIEYHIDYELTNGFLMSTNTVVLNPVPHIQDNGEIYYFGFKPSLR